SWINAATTHDRQTPRLPIGKKTTRRYRSGRNATASTHAANAKSRAQNNHESRRARPLAFAALSRAGVTSVTSTKIMMNNAKKQIYKPALDAFSVPERSVDLRSTTPSAEMPRNSIHVPMPNRPNAPTSEISFSQSFGLH